MHFQVLFELALDALALPAPQVAPHLLATAQLTTPCDLEPLGRSFVGLQFRHFFTSFLYLWPRCSCLSPPVALTLSFFCLPDALSLRYPALFAFGDKPPLSACGTQDATLGHLLAETLEQAFL
jgi:hypothetical protein